MGIKVALSEGCSSSFRSQNNERRSRQSQKSKEKDLTMKTTYLLFVLGLLCAVAYSMPIEDNEPLEDELLEGNFLKKIFQTIDF